jgi:hypothetical protein
MFFRLTNNDLNRNQANHQITCRSTREREARTLALQLRQKGAVSKQSRPDSLLSQAVKTERPRSEEQMLIYYWKVAHILDAPEGKGMVGDSLTPDQLEMVLSLLPKGEVNHWRMSQLNVVLGELPAHSASL